MRQTAAAVRRSNEAIDSGRKVAVPAGAKPVRMEIRDKVALITGASEGIGAACAAALRKRGAKLSLIARSRQNLEAVGGPEAVITAGDLTDPAIQKTAIEATIARHGRVDILINNAGAGVYSPSWDSPQAETRKMFELNLFAPWQMTQLAVPHMRAQSGGVIVNVSSIAGKVTLPWFTLYSASKYALCSFSDGLRMEVRQFGIRVISVCPGYVDTGFQRHILAGEVPRAVAGGKRFAVNADACAAAVVRGIERNARTVVTPRIGWLFIVAARLFPRVVDAQLERINARQSRRGGARAA